MRPASTFCGRIFRCCLELMALMSLVGSLGRWSVTLDCGAIKRRRGRRACSRLEPTLKSIWWRDKTERKQNFELGRGTGDYGLLKACAYDSRFQIPGTPNPFSQVSSARDKKQKQIFGTYAGGARQHHTRQQKTVDGGSTARACPCFHHYPRDTHLLQLSADKREYQGGDGTTGGWIDWLKVVD